MLIWLVCVLVCFSLALSCMGLFTSWTWSTISFSMLGKFSSIISSKTFSYRFFFSSSSGNLIIQNADAFNIVPEVSESVLSSFNSFYYILLFSNYFHHFIASSLICSSASDILLAPSKVFLIRVIVLFVCLFFNYSRSLLIDSCIFSILFWRFWIILTIIILISFSGGLPISSYLDLCFSSLFLHLCSISLLFHFLNLLCLRSLISKLQGQILSSFTALIRLVQWLVSA